MSAPAGRRPTTRGSKRSAGFTLIEMAITLSITAVIVPGVYLWWRAAEKGLNEAAAQLESADAARTVSEELRRDLLTLSWKDAGAVVLTGKAPCAEVRYEVADGVLHRRAPGSCGGGDRAIARHVESLRRTTWGVEMTFARRLGASSEPFSVTVQFAGGEAP